MNEKKIKILDLLIMDIAGKELRVLSLFYVQLSSLRHWLYRLKGNEDCRERWKFTDESASSYF
jgi:hypothetical protein